MSGWVLDASVALAWSLADEDSARADRFMAGLAAKDVLCVPALWWSEVANALLVAERRGRLSEADVLRALELFRRLSLETDFVSGPEALWRLRAIGREHGLSAYDAAYLELAARRQLGLATLDAALAKAAAAAGVRVFS